MFKSVNKAIVALVMSVVYLVNHFFGVGIDLDENSVSNFVSVVVSMLTPVLVYFVPNK